MYSPNRPIERERIWLKSDAPQFLELGECRFEFFFEKGWSKFLEGKGAWWWTISQRPFFLLCRFIPEAHASFALWICCKVIGYEVVALMLSQEIDDNVTYLHTNGDDAFGTDLVMIWFWTVSKGKWKIDSSAKASSFGQKIVPINDKAEI